jgi:[NiFe] hydrogenase diaphorase moiety large subunit
MMTAQQDTVRDVIERSIERHGTGRDCLIPVLQDVRKRFHSISDLAMQTVADRLGVSPMEVYGVVSFFPLLDKKRHGRFHIQVCRTVTCDMAGKDAIAQQLRNDLGIEFGETTPDGRYTLEWVNCMGLCDQGPALSVNEHVFTRVTAAQVHDILTACAQRFDSQALTDEEAHAALPIRNEMTLATIEKNAGLEAALALTPAQVVDAVRDSGLRGRGGAGFLTGLKWSLAASAPGDRRYLICNGAEGEPGAFKDRVTLLEWPDLVFEGMTIAGYAIGAAEGVLYLRGKYASLQRRLESCLQRRREAGMLGQAILGKPGFDFDIRIYSGSGAYICGEETALIESMEGRRGEARNRPPFPVSTGFHGAPTSVNNVETCAWTSAIFAKGASWFKSLGTQKSMGPKLLSVSGDVARPGVYEFPLGVSVKEVLRIAGGENAKAVAVAGASGPCIPASQFDRVFSYEDLSTNGAVIVFGPHRDMLHVAESFLDFFVDESCGQCAPCRIGSAALLEGVRKLKRGACSSRQLRDLCSLGETMRLTCKCGLGQSAPTVFLSIVTHFREEALGRAAAI